MFYDPNKQRTNLPILKWLGYAAILFFVFIMGVAVGSTETEETPTPESVNPPVQIAPTATPIPVPTAKKFPTSAPTPTHIPVDITSPEFNIYGARIGDCRLLISNRIFVSLSKDEYEDILRRERCSEERIEELLAVFAEGQAEARAYLGIDVPVVRTPTSLPIQDTTGRCSASPDCALEVSSSELEDYYRSDSSRWDLTMVEGSGAGAGKRIFTANSKTDAGYYITWIEREGVGVQLVEMVAHLPMACSMFESFANVQSNLANLMKLTIPPPVELNYFGRTYQIGCSLTSSQSKVSDVVNGVLVTVNYVDVEDIRLLDFTFWPCGEREESGACQWSKS